MQAIPDSPWPAAPGYLLSHSVGLPPAGVEQKIHDALLAPWRAANDQVWPLWLARLTEFRAAIASVINHDAKFVCPQSNVSSGVTKVLGALPADPLRPVLLITERAFPSLGFVFAMARRQGMQVRLIGKSENTLDPSVWRKHLSDDVRAVLITHVHSNTSEQLPVEAICKIAHRRGIASIVDVAQSAGIVDVDARRWDADFISGSCVKWLCGGPGAGFLWVHPDTLSECQPQDVGWFSHENPFEFDIHQFRYADDALRFWGGTPSVAPFVIATASVSALYGLGLDQVRRHNQHLLAKLTSALDASDIVSPNDPAGRGGTIVVNLGKRQQQFADRLVSASIQFDQRAKGIRLSPHVYNSEQDIDALIDAIPD